MKFHILSFLLLLLCLQSSAQRLQMNDTTNRWEFLREYNSASQGHTWVKVWTSIHESEQTKQVNGYEYAKIGWWFRDDILNRKLYVWDSTNNADILIMDYALNKGDTFTATIQSTTVHYEITAADSVTINGYPHKRLFLSATNYWPDALQNHLGFIEGIGFTAVHPLAVITEVPSPYPNWEGVPALGCFKNSTGIRLNNSNANDSTCLHRITNIAGLHPSRPAGIYPQPASDKATLVLPAQVDNAVLSICDMQGRVVYTQHIKTSSIVEITNDNSLNGIYFYRVSGAAVSYSGKIVFQ